MKKTIFLGISLLSIGICLDKVWGALARNSVRYTRNSYNSQARGRSNVERRRVNTRQSTVRNSTNRNFANNMNMGSAKSVLSNIRLEKSILDELKDIIDKVPSKDIRVLQGNMSSLSSSLRRRNSAEDIETVIDKMNKAQNCFDDLLIIRSSLYLNLFNKSEERANLSDCVDLDGIIKGLNQVNTKKLGDIIAICTKEQSLKSVTENLKKFSNRIKESKKFLEEMRQQFSKTVLSQIEGIPQLENLESTNIPSNRRLAELRENSGYDSGYDSDDDVFNTQGIQGQQPVGGSNSGNGAAPQTTLGQPNIVLTGTVDNTGSTPAPQGAQEQQPVGGSNSSDGAAPQTTLGQPNIVLTGAGDSSSSTAPPQGAQEQQTVGGSNSGNGTASQTTPEQPNTVPTGTGDSSSSTPPSQGAQEQQTGSNTEVNTNLPEKTFLKTLELTGKDLDSLTEEGKKKVEYKKVRECLEKAESERSFEQNVFNAKRLVKAYNSLVALNPQTKDGKSLSKISDREMKSLIYSDVFNGMESRMKGLKTDSRFKDFEENIDIFLKLNEKNKKDFFDSDFFKKFLERIENDKKNNGKGVKFVDFLEENQKDKEIFEKFVRDRKRYKELIDFVNDKNRAKSCIAMYKRGLMSASADAYDRLVEKIWKGKPELNDTVDRIGPDLVEVIKSIDVNEDPWVSDNVSN